MGEELGELGFVPGVCGGKDGAGCWGAGFEDCLVEEGG